MNLFARVDFILAIQAIVSFFLSFFVLSCGYMHGCDHIVIDIGGFSEKSPITKCQ